MSVMTVAVPAKYREILSPLGDIQQLVNEALRRYALEQVADKIAELRAREEAWEEKYGCDYETFVEKVSTDEDFVKHIEQTINPTWEIDLAEWEFCHKGVKDWTQHLQALLTG